MHISYAKKGRRRGRLVTRMVVLLRPAQKFFRRLWFSVNLSRNPKIFFVAIATLIVTFFLLSGTSWTTNVSPLKIHAMAERDPLRLLFITLEYKAGTFSGNGVYSQSQVRSLTRLGHQVFVLSAAPEASTTDVQSRKSSEEVKLIEIPVPAWGRLDRQSGWREFADGVTPEICSEIAEFNPQWALIVDWSAVGAYKRLVSSRCWGDNLESVPPMAYLNYR
jgi:hypothetical protein